MPKHDKSTNLNAGLLTEEDGPDAATREALLARLAPREPSVVGNLADLQRAGGLIATSQASSFSEGVEPPPGKTSEGLAAEAKAAETVNQALADAAEKVESVRVDANADAAVSGSAKPSGSKGSDKK